MVLGKDILKEKRVYIFLDEIQKLKDWQNQIKIFYDLYPNLKFIVSKRAMESLAGRTFEYLLPLLSFSEFLSILGEEVPEGVNLFDFSDLKELNLKRERLSPLFFSYLKNGGFIEIIKEDFRIKKYSRSILERVVFSDIPQCFKIKEPQILRSIIEIVASNPGFLLDYSKLGEVFHKDQRTISNYIFYLFHSLLIQLLQNFSGSMCATERKMRKIYLASTNFIYYFQKDKFHDPEFLGKVIENLLVSFSKGKYFWRERGHEVDMVLKENVPVEVKYWEKVTESDLKGLRKFIKRFNPKKAIILTKDELREEMEEGVPIFLFLPGFIS